jgi:hypothetical protein
LPLLSLSEDTGRNNTPISTVRKKFGTCNRRYLVFNGDEDVNVVGYFNSSHVFVLDSNLKNIKTQFAEELARVLMRYNAASRGPRSSNTLPEEFFQKN